MKAALNWLYCTILGALQRRCQHPTGLVSHDICEGDLEEPIGWCRICGAARFRQQWREPRADWWILERKVLKDSS
jgi:hypothetical protein